LKRWFSAYVGGFYSGGQDPYLDKHIRLKEEHTARVCQEMQYILHGLDVSESDARLAEAAALLHDVGRFEQFRRFRTYVDPKSCDHGQLGVQVLSENGGLEGLENTEQTILLDVVRWHGAKAVPADLDERSAFFCRLVRDADKLDVLGLLIDNFTRYYEDPQHFDLEVEFADEPFVSEAVLESIFRGELVDYRQIRTLHDAQMVLLGWVYDINFDAALARIQDKRYLDRIAAFLPDKPEIHRAVEHIFSYVRTRLNAMQ
jgi:hypothetical protein